MLLVNDQSATFSFAGIGVGPETSVPEPATLALLGMGLAMLGFSHRRHASVSSQNCGG
jgi:hypothetical protein